MLKNYLTLGVVLLAFGLGLHKAWQQPAPASGFRMPVFEDAPAQPVAVEPKRLTRRQYREHLAEKRQQERSAQP